MTNGPQHSRSRLKWVFKHLSEPSDHWIVGIGLPLPTPTDEPPAVLCKPLFEADTLEHAHSVLRELGADKEPRRALEKLLRIQPGQFYGDLLAVEEDRDEDALARLVNERRVEPYHPFARREWSRRVDAAGGFEAARHRLLSTAIFLALTRVDEPQRIRRGQEYVLDSDGKPAKVIPSELDLREAFPWWVEKEIRKASEGLLTEDRSREVVFSDLMAKAETTDEDSDSMVPGTVPWLDASMAPSPEEEDVLALLKQRLSPMERQLLGLVTTGFSVREAAKRMGIAEGTACSHWGRLLKKVAKMAAEM